MKKIAMIGVGYVGLVSGTGLADFGNEVVCADIDEKKIDMLNNGQLPIYEPGLLELVEKNVDKGRLKFTTDVESAIRKSEVIFIAVPTPPMDDGEVDLSYVFDVVDRIASAINEFKVVVTKSTVPVGTGDEIKKRLLEKGVDRKLFEVVSNPEFLREGSAVNDFMRPDRVVIGTESEKALEIMRDIYRPLYLIETPIVATDIRTAEMIKYSSNAFLATKISYINEVGNICKKLGINVYDVAKGMALDHRISDSFLAAGLGFGGSCLPKDVKALIHRSGELNIKLDLLDSVIKVNEKQAYRMLELARKKTGPLKNKKIALLGAAFKPGTDDIRESPVHALIKKLHEEKAKVVVYDPQANGNMKKEYGKKISYALSADDALLDAELALIVTAWREFELLDFSLMKEPVVVDGRNIIKNKKNIIYEGLCCRERFV